MRGSAIGTGLIAKPGRRVSIYYVGTLMSDGTIFEEKRGVLKAAKAKAEMETLSSSVRVQESSLNFYRGVWRG